MTDDSVNRADDNDGERTAWAFEESPIRGGKGQGDTTATSDILNDSNVNTSLAVDSTDGDDSNSKESPDSETQIKNELTEGTLQNGSSSSTSSGIDETVPKESAKEIVGEGNNIRESRNVALSLNRKTLDSHFPISGADLEIAGPQQQLSRPVETGSRQAKEGTQNNTATDGVGNGFSSDLIQLSAVFKSNEEHQSRDLETVCHCSDKDTQEEASTTEKEQDEERGQTSYPGESESGDERESLEDSSNVKGRDSESTDYQPVNSTERRETRAEGSEEKTETEEARAGRFLIREDVQKRRQGSLAVAMPGLTEGISRMAEEDRGKDRTESGVSIHEENEVEAFAANENPALVLAEVRKQLASGGDSVKDKSIMEQYEDRSLDSLSAQAGDIKAALTKTKTYLTTFTEEVKTTRQTINDVSTILHEKLRKEYLPPEDREKPTSPDELHLRQRAAEADRACVQAVQQLVEIQQLAAQIEKNAYETAAMAAKQEQEAAETDGKVAAAQEQARKESEEEETRRRQRREEEEKTLRKQRQEEEEERRRQKQLEEKEKEKPEREEKNKMEFECVNKEQERELVEDYSTFLYYIQSHADTFGSGVGCALRCKAGIMEKMQVDCFPVNLLDSTYCPGDEEEIMSNVLCVKSKGALLDFQPKALLSIPYTSVRGNSSAREVVLKVETEHGKWTAVATKDVVHEEGKNLRFLETPLSCLDKLNIVAVSRVKVDKESFNQRGGKMTSTVDSRVILTVPKAAFRFTTELQLQVLPVDSLTLSEVKSRYSCCQPLLGTSPFLTVRTATRPVKQLTVWLPSPSGAARNRPKTSVGPRVERVVPSRPASAWPSTKAPKDDEGHDDEESIFALEKTSTGWHELAPMELVYKRDVARMELGDSLDRLLLMRIQGNATSHDAIRMAHALEASFQERVINFIVRQNTQDVTEVLLDCSRQEKTGKLLRKLEEDGYGYGPQPGDALGLKEGQKIEVAFRGNISADNADQTSRFAFLSNINTARLKFGVKEVDRFAQHGLDFYRGHVQFFLLETADSKKVEEKEDGAEKVWRGIEYVRGRLLCELPVTLPKSPTQHTVLQRAPSRLWQEDGPLTESYLKRLSRDLGDEWHHLADCLGVTRVRVQGILREHAASGDKDKAIQDMIMSWYRKCPKSSDKVAELFWALKDCGRDDLAHDLLDRNSKFQEEQEKHIQEEKMRRAIKIVTDCPGALKNWKQLAAALKVSPENVADIEKAHDTIRDQCHQVLARWRQSYEKSATMKVLARALKKINLKDAAERVFKIR